jgi:hypothetical protein
MATFQREAADCLAVLRQQQQVRSGSLSSAGTSFVKVTATTFTAASDGRRSFKHGVTSADESAGTGSFNDGIRRLQIP